MLRLPIRFGTSLPQKTVLRHSLVPLSTSLQYFTRLATTTTATTLEESPVITSIPNEQVTEASPIREKKTFQMRSYKPLSPGLRWLRRPIHDHLWKGRAYLPLTVAKRGQGGRNSTGRVTVRHQGGGHKRRIRVVDFKRVAGGPHTVERIEYDPGRSGHVALLCDFEGVKSYILASDGLRQGDVVESYLSGIPDALIQEMGGEIDPGMLSAKTVQRGNCLPLSMIPTGTIIHAISTSRGGPAKFCRSAGTYGQVITSPKHGYAVVKLQSGELRKIPTDASATIGIVSNSDHHHTKLGKAGRSRWLGIRPTVRGVAMYVICSCKKFC